MRHDFLSLAWKRARSSWLFFSFFSSLFLIRPLSRPAWPGCVVHLSVDFNDVLINSFINSRCFFLSFRGGWLTCVDASRRTRSTRQRLVRRLPDTNVSMAWAFILIFRMRSHDATNHMTVCLMLVGGYGHEFPFPVPVPFM